MRRGQLSACASVVLLLVMSGCSDQGRSQHLSPLMPLSVGNEWGYSQYWDNPDTGQPIYQREDTIKIVAVGELAGKQYYLTNTDLAFQLTNRGLSLAQYEGNAFDDLEILFLYPLADGTEYEYLSDKVSQPVLFVTMTTGQQSTPSGDYACYTYDVCHPRDTFFLAFSFAPGIGLVRMKNYMGTSWLLSSVTLVEHEPNWPLQPPGPYSWR